VGIKMPMHAQIEMSEPLSVYSAAQNLTLRPASPCTPSILIASPHY
jgi:hypothetical protein